MKLADDFKMVNSNDNDGKGLQESYEGPEVLLAECGERRKSGVAKQSRATHNLSQGKEQRQSTAGFRQVGLVSC